MFVVITHVSHQQFKFFRPSMNVPKRAFYVHPLTQFPSLSISRWYSLNDPTCLTCERALSKSSQSDGLNQVYSSSSKSSQDSTTPSFLYDLRSHCHHWFASPSKWKVSKDTFWASGMAWNSKNWCTCRIISCVLLKLQFYHFFTNTPIVFLWCPLQVVIIAVSWIFSSFIIAEGSIGSFPKWTQHFS